MNDTGDTSAALSAPSAVLDGESVMDTHRRGGWAGLNFVSNHSLHISMHARGPASESSSE